MTTRTIYYGDEYWKLHKDGAIERPHLVAPNAKTWRVIGAVTRNNFGTIVRSWSLAEILAEPGKIPWSFKNGKQRTFIRDLDHGSMREWGSPGHRIS